MTATTSLFHLEVFSAQRIDDIASFLKGGCSDDKAVKAMDVVLGFGKGHGEREAVDA